MVQIHTETENKDFEHIKINIDEKNFDFLRAKDMAKKTALEKCSQSMILSWKNGVTGEVFPDYECGEKEKPFWIRYAEGRNANLVIEFNEGEYIFMILKI